MDLDLPSGTLWSTMNVGAFKPSDFGFYFQWGDTSGYTADQIGTENGKKKFASDWSDYKFGKPNFSKYKIKGVKLELEDDAAHVHMGGNWHMPTPEQIKELLNKTTTARTTSDGAIGVKFTSKEDTSKFIFIPAAGHADNGSVYNAGSNGAIWSSMLSTGRADYGQYLDLHTDSVHLFDNFRHYGFRVRGVLG